MLRNRQSRTTSVRNLFPSKKKEEDDEDEASSNAEEKSREEDPSTTADKPKKRLLGIFPRKTKEKAEEIEETDGTKDKETSPNQKKNGKKNSPDKGKTTEGEEETTSSAKRWLGVFPRKQPADETEKGKQTKDTTGQEEQQDEEEKGKPFSIGSTVRATAAYNKVRDFQDSRKKIKPRDGDHRLHDACREGNLERCKYLIEVKECDVNGKCKHFTPLQSAIKEEHLEIVHFLVTEHDARICEGFNGGAFLTACEVGNKAIVKFLAQKRPQSAQTDHGIFQKGALLMASEKGHTDVVLYLIKRCQVDVNAVDAYGSTALHGACANGHTDVVKCLVDKGKADPTLKTTNTGDTALHRAAVFGHKEAAEVILEKFPELIHERNNDLQTPLTLAQEKGHNELLAVLQVRAADVPDPFATELESAATATTEEEAKVSLDQEPPENLVFHPQPSRAMKTHESVSSTKIAPLPSLVPIQKNKDTAVAAGTPAPRQTVTAKVDEEDFASQFRIAVSKSGLARRLRDFESKLKLNETSFESLNERVERIEDELEIFRLHWLDSNAANAATQEAQPEPTNNDDNNHNSSNGSNADDRVAKLESENKLLWDRLLYLETEIMEQRNQGAGFAKV